MTLMEFLLLILVAGICGALGQAIAGYSRGGCLVSVAVGLIGAILGIWLARALVLPPIVMVDIDHFKKINDTYGHAAGDAVLVRLVRAVTALLRQHDIVGRTGGEEFCAALGNTDLATAESVAQRMCRALSEASVVHDGQRVVVTVSIGVAQCDPERDSVESAIRRADLAMYEAKRKGRNQVVVAGPAAVVVEDRRKRT